MDVVILPALKDNYMYLLIDQVTKECAAIDPVEPKNIIEYIKINNLCITHILTTHHHWDHAGGNNSLVSLLKNKVLVVGGDDRIESLNLKVSHNNKIYIGNIEVECLCTPCHTTGHICYLARNKLNELEDPIVFTGDTLFIAGCGKFFEGSADQMFYALIEILGKLPTTTKVYCGHEYTVKNLKFALTIEPHNKYVHKKLEWAQNKQSGGEFTVPSTIMDELLTNPFMRVNQSSVMQSCNSSDTIKVMEILRKLKDNF